MNDITERLRSLYVQHGTDYVQEAADEIERLRAAFETQSRSRGIMNEHEREIALSVAYEMWSAGVVYIGPSSVQLLLFADRFLNRIRSDQNGSSTPPSAPSAPATEPNNDEVICPQCCHQFRAIPVSVQRLMLDAGFEPPFTEPPTPPSAPEGWEANLLDWVSACQSSYHIDNTPGHRFGGLGSNLDENRACVVEYVRELLASAPKPEDV